MNLVNLLQEQFSGDALDQLSSEIGADPERTGRAATAAVPTLLAGLAKLATNDDGVRKLTGVLGSLDENVPGSISQALSGNSAGLLNQGMGMLNNLFGNSMLSSVASSIGRYAGIDPSLVQRLLGFIAPLVLGKVASQWQSQGGTTSALTSFLGDQARHIPNALPPGFSLDQVPGLSGVADTMRDTSQSARRAVESANTSSPSMASWLMPIAAILLVGFLLWNFIQPKNATEPSVAEKASTEAQKVTAMRPPTLDATLPTLPEANDKLKAMFTQLNDTLASIKDEASAEAALPKLQELNAQIDAMKALMAKMPETGRVALQKTMEETIDPLKQQAQTTLAMPSLSDRVKTLIQQIIQKLEDWKIIETKA